MANPNAPFGLHPVRHLFGGLVRPNEYTIADAYNTSLFTGDPVVVTGTGKNIARATAGSSGVITGVFAGCKYTETDGSHVFSKYWPASTSVLSGSTTTALVYDDPFILYEIEYDGALVAADIRLMTDLVAGTGSTASGLSGFSCTGVAGSENQLKIYGLSNTIRENTKNAYGENAVIEVLIANHEFVSDHQEV